MNLAEIQKQLLAQNLDGWLFFDHHFRDPLAYRVLGLTASHVTRRWYYLIPAQGEPLKLVHRIESHVLDSLEGSQAVYSSWAEQTGALARLLSGCRRVAMQYSPNCAIPYVSLVDGGTLELVRLTGVEVVTSAELIQFFEARLSAQGLESHLAAGKLVDRVRSDAFEYINAKLRAGESLNEWDLASFVRKEFARAGLHSENGPIVGVDAHAGDPHYEPQEQGSSPIESGSFVLLDMWAKLDQPGSVYYDITWTAYCGTTPPGEIERVFDIVKNARNAGIHRTIAAFEQEEPLRGFQVDDATREVIQASGYGDRFVHRTGHSIGTEVHGNSANMDNLETHDDRLIMPWSCFSIEPGIYLETFGIRSEVNMFIDDHSARVTGEVQDRLVLLA